MASKSRRGRGKYSPPSKKRKRRQIYTATATQQVVAQTYGPVAPSKVAPPSVKEPTPAVARYPHIGTELRRIGILAGIILVTLAVLALILS